MAETERQPKHFKDLFKKIRSIIFAAAERRPDATSPERYRKFRDTLSELKTSLDGLEESQRFITERCHEYDYTDASSGVRTEGNGYRSMLSVLEQFLGHFSDWFSESLKPSLFGSSLDDQFGNLNTAKRAINGMVIVFNHAVNMMKTNSTSLLQMDYRDILKAGLTEDLALDFFYGRFLGFQYSSGVKTFLSYLAISFTCYDHWYTSNEGLLTKIFLRLLKTAALDDNERGIMIANVSDGATIQLTKAFWSLPDKKEFQTVLRIVNKLFIPAEVFTDVTIPPDTIQIKNVYGDNVSVKPPISETGDRSSVRLLLISNKWRQGQPPPSNYRSLTPAVPSETILIHIHGGGFVATSPNAHESYLRSWSRELDCPVISIDYSLAPEAPFPRALEECVFAYSWIMENLKSLGTTGAKVILVGDSAGGNLVLATSMRLKLIDIHQPHHIVSFYPAIIIKLCATPSRFLALFDLILPLGILIACLQAYTGDVFNEEIVRKRREIREMIYKAKGHTCPPVFRLLRSPQVAAKNQTHSLPSLEVSSPLSSMSIDRLTSELISTYKDMPITNNPLLSPALAPNDMLKELPPVTLICGSLDPLLDDGVMFANRLKALNHPITLRIFQGLPHGFMNILHWSEDIQEAKQECIDILRKIVDPS